eukprot:CAMPEP_0119064164 /NCGR_PEP_ID=MMETSP1178-20130426/7326_1 /TAXON_ID=33656 /ORGANISM="unid sp, Strain CCMP2000" /LENGTH=154 /DNA_ID=CAMNT_0007045587 /DNA_START=37 /DNA_END=501 /DNA_ORIENTATION=-
MSGNYRVMYDQEKKRRLASERHVKVLLEQLEELGVEPRTLEKIETPTSAPEPAPAPVSLPPEPVPELVSEPVFKPAPAPAPAPAPRPLPPSKPFDPVAAAASANAAQIRQDLRMACMSKDVAALEIAIQAAVDANMHQEAATGRRKLASLCAES